MFQRKKQHSSSISQDPAQTQLSLTISIAPANAPFIGQEPAHAHALSTTSIPAPSHAPSPASILASFHAPSLAHVPTTAIPAHVPRFAKSSSRPSKLHIRAATKSSSRGQSSQFGGGVGILFDESISSMRFCVTGAGFITHTHAYLHFFNVM